MTKTLTAGILNLVKKNHYQNKMISRATFLKSLLLLPLLGTAKKLPDLEKRKYEILVNGGRYTITPAELKYIEGNILNNLGLAIWM